MKRIFKIEILLSGLIFGILLLFAFNTDTTGDAGDSIMHYLYAHYSFQYPQFFLHHWAKPFFVLCSAPFAQFGFKGIIVFNCLCATLTALFTYYIARDMKIRHAWLVFLFIFFAPLYFKLVFSGLTEYLFGLFLVIGIYLVVKSKYAYAAGVISFLPLIRSEGLIILGVFALFYLIRKQYKALPYLLFGQLIYTAIGAFYYNDILWVLNKIPYANMGSPYGNGELLDFVHRLNYVIEKPIYLLLVIGSLSLAYTLIRRRPNENITIKIILVFGSFLSLIVAHSIFWWLGIFNSMGLARVLIAVVPVIALISLLGVQAITGKIQNSKITYAVLAGISLVVLIYPFTHREQGVVFDKELFVLKENRLIDEEVVPYIESEFPNYGNNTLYFSQPYFSLALDIDYFDPAYHREMQAIPNHDVPNESIIIWDDWYSPTEGGVSLKQITDDSRFKHMQTFERTDGERTVVYSVFKTIGKE